MLAILQHILPGSSWWAAARQKVLNSWDVTYECQAAYAGDLCTVIMHQQGYSRTALFQVVFTAIN